MKVPSVLSQFLFVPLFLFSLSAQSGDYLSAQSEDAMLGFPIASGELVGTTLSVMPNIPFEDAVLRVVGPEGYALSIAFQGGEIIDVDLLMDAEQRRSGQQAENEGPVAWNTLPPGFYRYETVFDGATGDPQVHSGQFEIQ